MRRRIHQYSQNFNRYSYVLNNPLNKTDPSGYSWLSKAFDKIGNWFSENWRVVVSIVVGALLIWTGVGAAMFWGLHGLTGAAVVGTHAAVVYGGIGAITGAIMGGLNAALAGGDLGDVLKGAVVGGVQGAICGGILHGLNDGFGFDNISLHIAGHGVVGGAANEAMGGKFQDGFLSAAASAAGSYLPVGNKNIVTGTIKSGVIGGTASAIGGGKFANGAWTSAFQHLLNDEIDDWIRQGGKGSFSNHAFRNNYNEAEIEAAALEAVLTTKDLAESAVAVGSVAKIASKPGFWARIGNFFRFGRGAAPAAAKTVVDPNRINHIFGKAEHALDDLVAAFGSEEAAFAAVQKAANEALAAGKLATNAKGILPTGDAGHLVNVAGLQVRLIGGRVVDGVVEISSFSRKGL